MDENKQKQTQPVQLEQQDIYLINVLGGQIQNTQAELQRLMQARDNLVSMLENKHCAIFNPQTGTFHYSVKETPEK